MTVENMPQSPTFGVQIVVCGQQVQVQGPQDRLVAFQILIMGAGAWLDEMVKTVLPGQEIEAIARAEIARSHAGAMVNAVAALRACCREPNLIAVPELRMKGDLPLRGNGEKQ